jgi:hypothetical protein
MFPATPIRASSHYKAYSNEKQEVNRFPKRRSGRELGDDLQTISTDLLRRCDVPQVPVFEKSEAWKRGWSRGFYGLSLDEGIESEIEELRRGYEAGRIAWLLALPPNQFD